MDALSLKKFQSVADDLNWLWDEWWIGQPDKLSLSHIRRGSPALHLLLNQGLLGRAWRAAGFKGEPNVIAPDMEALANDAGVSLSLAVSCIAGGGRQNGIDASFIGGFRVCNPSTGIAATAEEGFAVQVISLLKLAGDSEPPTDLDRLVQRSWHISQYLNSTSAVRRGIVITRAEIVEYFRNFAGGAHLDRTDDKAKTKRPHYELIAELEEHLEADIRDGLHFELLSIGQAIAKSPDMRKLSTFLSSHCGT